MCFCFVWFEYCRTKSSRPGVNLSDALYQYQFDVVCLSVFVKLGFCLRVSLY